MTLIQKYNYSGPRYTSYPTALEFSESLIIRSLLSDQQISAAPAVVMVCTFRFVM